jgi:hypothetical protein
VADHIPDDQVHGSIGVQEGVVPVPADLADARRGQVADGDLAVIGLEGSR